ncbi:MAG: hypothetical protein IIY74_06250 [Firmicutes bacterium]|nr:hypothetical protein [Bacillota bacterium]
MKLIGNLKEQVESERTKEGKKKLIEKAGMLLTDDELDRVAGGNYYHYGKNMPCSYDPNCEFVFTERCASCSKRPD